MSEWKKYPCWLHEVRTNKDGYGVKDIDGTDKFMHHLTYQACFPKEYQAFMEMRDHAHLEIDHLCRVRNCCNPWHLEIVTKSENQRRSQSPAGINARKTICKHGHPLTSENLIQSELKKGRRVCRLCYEVRLAEQRLKRGKVQRKQVVTKKITPQMETIDIVKEGLSS